MACQKHHRWDLLTQALSQLGTVYCLWSVMAQFLLKTAQTQASSLLQNALSSEPNESTHTQHSSQDWPALPFPSKMSNEFLLQHMTPATTQISQPQGCCCPLYVILPFLFISLFNDQLPSGSNSTQRKKKCHYLNYAYSASAPKSASSPLFSQFMIFTCLHGENQQPGPTDLERISQECLSFCCEKK